MIRVLSALLSWSVPRGYRTDNPCEFVPKFTAGDGWAPWPWEAIEHFRDAAVPDMWLAAALALYRPAAGRCAVDKLDLDRIRCDRGRAAENANEGVDPHSQGFAHCARRCTSSLHENPHQSARAALDAIAYRLNTRPRKILGFKMPLEVYAEQIAALSSR